MYKFRGQLILAMLTATILGLIMMVGVGSAETNVMTSCVDGMAGEFPCKNINLYGRLTLEELGGDTEAGIFMSDMWGWTSPDTGKEYVIAGLRDRTVFVDISNPTDPILLGTLHSAVDGLSNYRDMKVYKNYAFIVADEPLLDHGMQVFDLTELDAVVNPPVVFDEAAHYSGFSYGHNMWINEDSGFAYVFRSDTCNASNHMVDINDPLNPTFAGCFDSDGADSDAECIIYDGPDTNYTGKEICVTGSDGSMTVGDVTDKDNPVTLAIVTYPNIARAHQGAFSTDRRYFLVSDTMDENMMGFNTRTHLLDMADLENPTYVGYYQHDTAASDHNLYTVNDRAVVMTNWKAGFHYLDLGDDMSEFNWVEKAYFDTHPEDDLPGIKSGSWSSYPWFKSGVIALTDVERGLFLLQVSLEPTDVSFGQLNGSLSSVGSAPAVMALAFGASFAAAAWVISKRKA